MSKLYSLFIIYSEKNQASRTVKTCNFCSYFIVQKFNREFVFSWFSLEIHVTVTQCCRLCTSVDRSVRKCWHTNHWVKEKKTCWHVWQISLTILQHRKRKLVLLLPKSLWRDCERKMVSITHFIMIHQKVVTQTRWKWADIKTL